MKPPFVYGRRRRRRPPPPFGIRRVRPKGYAVGGTVTSGYGAAADTTAAGGSTGTNPLLMSVSLDSRSHNPIHQAEDASAIATRPPDAPAAPEEASYAQGGEVRRQKRQRPNKRNTSNNEHKLLRRMTKSPPTGYLKRPEDARFYATYAAGGPVRRPEQWAEPELMPYLTNPKNLPLRSEAPELIEPFKPAPPPVGPGSRSFERIQPIPSQTEAPYKPERLQREEQARPIPTDPMDWPEAELPEEYRPNERPSWMVPLDQMPKPDDAPAEQLGERQLPEEKKPEPPPDGSGGEEQYRRGGAVRRRMRPRRRARTGYQEGGDVDDELSPPALQEAAAPPEAPAEDVPLPPPRPEEPVPIPRPRPPRSLRADAGVPEIAGAMRRDNQAPRGRPASGRQEDLATAGALRGAARAVNPEAFHAAQQDFPMSRRIQDRRSQRSIRRGYQEGGDVENERVIDFGDTTSTDFTIPPGWQYEPDDGGDPVSGGPWQPPEFGDFKEPEPSPYEQQEEQDLESGRAGRDEESQGGPPPREREPEAPPKPPQDEPEPEPPKTGYQQQPDERPPTGGPSLLSQLLKAINPISSAAAAETTPAPAPPQGPTEPGGFRKGLGDAMGFRGRERQQQIMSGGQPPTNIAPDQPAPEPAVPPQSAKDRDANWYGRMFGGQQVGTEPTQAARPAAQGPTHTMTLGAPVPTEPVPGTEPPRSSTDWLAHPIDTMRRGKENLFPGDPQKALVEYMQGKGGYTPEQMTQLLDQATRGDPRLAGNMRETIQKAFEEVGKTGGKEAAKAFVQTLKPSYNNVRAAMMGAAVQGKYAEAMQLAETMNNMLPDGHQLKFATADNGQVSATVRSDDGRATTFNLTPQQLNTYLGGDKGASPLTVFEIAGSQEKGTEDVFKMLTGSAGQSQQTGYDSATKALTPGAGQPGATAGLVGPPAQPAATPPAPAPQPQPQQRGYPFSSDPEGLNPVVGQATPQQLRQQGALQPNSQEELRNNNPEYDAAMRQYEEALRRHQAGQSAGQPTSQTYRVPSRTAPGGSRDVTVRYPAQQQQQPGQQSAHDAAQKDYELRYRAWQAYPRRGQEGQAQRYYEMLKNREAIADRFQQRQQNPQGGGRAPARTQDERLEQDRQRQDAQMERERYRQSQINERYRQTAERLTGQNMLNNLRNYTTAAQRDDMRRINDERRSWERVNPGETYQYRPEDQELIRQVHQIAVDNNLYQRLNPNAAPAGPAAPTTQAAPATPATPATPAAPPTSANGGPPPLNAPSGGSWGNKGTLYKAPNGAIYSKDGELLHDGR